MDIKEPSLTGRVLDTRAVSPQGLLAPGAKPGGGRWPPVGGPDRHRLTCGVLMAPRHQVNTESIASLQREDDESAIQTSGQDEHPDPTRSAHNSAQKGHTDQQRDGKQTFQRGNHIAQGGHEGNQEAGLSLSQVSAACKRTAGTKCIKPQRPRWGGRQHSPWLSPHIWAREESWGQQQGRDGCREMPQSRASQSPPSVATLHRCPVH